MDEQELKKEITITDNVAGAIVVTNKETFEAASDTVMHLDHLIKKITTYWDEPIKTAYAAHKILVGKREEMLKPVQGRRRILTDGISKYLAAQELARMEAQRKLDEARRKQEAAEREKLQARAEKAEEKGKVEAAAVLREKADNVFIPPALATSEVEKTNRMESGTVTAKKDIEIKIDNPLAVVKQIAAGVLPVSIITINESKLKQWIKLNAADKLDGVVISEKISAQFRSRV